MNSLLVMFTLATYNFNLPAGLLSAVCWVESNHDVRVYLANDGGSPSHGLCQVKLATARSMGFRGGEIELRKPETNIHYAAKYLSHQLIRYDGDARKAIAAYNSGTYRLNSRGLIKNRKYVRKVLIAWAEQR